MSNSNRGREDGDLGGFGILAAIALCCLIVGGLAYSNGVEGQRGKQYTAAYEKTAKANAIRSCSKINRAPTVECIYEQIETSQNESRAEKDLQAQQGMKFWAAAMAFLTLGTLVITAFGVWFVKRTLDATLKAVEDTGNATAAMIVANEIAIDAKERQFRAYVFPVSAGISDVELGKSPKAEIVYTNCGTAFAQNVDTDTWFDLYPKDVNEEYLIPQPVEGTSSGPLAPGKGASGFMVLSRILDERLFNAWKKGEANLIFFGKVTYTDCFGKNRETGFRYICAANKCGPDGTPALITASKGNYAT